SALRVHLTLNHSLRLCGDNETDADCCAKPLCVLETLQVSACIGSTPQASLLIQNKTVFPNQVYQPLGACPCDLTSGTCDPRCCCDKDCSSEDLKLFESHCLPGPFGGQVSPAPDYQCSMQSAENSPDWFPFLCVTSPAENNPYLGLFYQGDTAPRPGPSFQMPALSAPVPVSIYVQGSPIITSDNKYFTVPQCINGAPVAFLQNFKLECVTLIHSCPTGPPLKMLEKDLSPDVLNGQGETLVCENVTLALDYKFYWKGNGITSISLTRTVGTVVLNGSAVTTRYSAVFLNGESVAEPNSGNPYQVGRPLIAGVLDNNTELIQKTLINGDGLCSSAVTKPVLFGENSTSGCLLPLRQLNVTQCDLLENPEENQLFPVTSSVTFIDIPFNTGPPKNFQINFTEYDCNRNDVCWPELAFPFTRYYTEPYSQALAKGMILVFMFLSAAILGTPWRQIRQAWHNA
uniref:Tectonic family member 2 n=1 Tax=Cyprinodon variegatus TaxID=28743 RepID=A0A3Q2DJQ2_CYPVA